MRPYKTPFRRGGSLTRPLSDQILDAFTQTAAFTAVVALNPYRYNLRQNNVRAEEESCPRMIIAATIANAASS